MRAAGPVQQPAARQRGASAAATSSKLEDQPGLLDHLVHHHEASTRGAVHLCHHSAAEGSAAEGCVYYREPEMMTISAR